MADVSVLITAKDNFSEAVKKMAQQTKSFGQDISTMQSSLNSINSQKYALELELGNAKKELKEAKSAIDSTANATDEMRERFAASSAKVETLKSNIALLSSAAKSGQKQIRELAESGEEGKKSLSGMSEAAEGVDTHLTGAGDSVDGLKTKLSQLSDESKDAQKQMQSLSDTAGTGRNGLTTSVQNLSDTFKGLSSAGLFKQLGDSISGLAQTELKSYYGDDAANAITSILSGITSGAAIGSVGGVGIGTAIGAVVGGVSGTVEAISAAQSKKDEIYSDYVTDQYNTWLETLQNNLTEGSETASGRETDRISFNTLLGSEESAASLLSDLQDYAAKTPFSYDDLTSASRTLLSYGIDQSEILEYIDALGNAGSAVGLSGSDIATLSTYLGRIKSNGYATQEYLNPLQERGIDVYGMLAEDIGISIADLKSEISKGNIDGTRAVETLIEKMEEQFGGSGDVLSSMEAMSQTYSGLTSTLEDTKAQLTAAQGEAYNEERKSGTGGLEDQIAWYDEHMEELQKGYSALGEYQASLENAQDQAYLDVMSKALESTEYQQAAAEENGALMGEILAEAQAEAQNQYLTSEAYSEYQSSQIELVERLQADASVNDAYYQLGTKLGQQLSKGLLAGYSLAESMGVSYKDESTTTTSHTDASGSTAYAAKQYEDLVASGMWDRYKDLNPESAAILEAAANGTSHAVGLSRVPYDGYPAILHEGERVLTANQTRQQDAGISGGVTVTIESCTVREQSDIDAIATLLYDKLAQASRGM